MEVSHPHQHAKSEERIDFQIAGSGAAAISGRFSLSIERNKHKKKGESLAYSVRYSDSELLQNKGIVSFLRDV